MDVGCGHNCGYSGVIDFTMNNGTKFRYFCNHKELIDDKLKEIENKKLIYCNMEDEYIIKDNLISFELIECMDGNRLISRGLKTNRLL